MTLPRQLGRYHLIDTLGKGAFGRVYRARRDDGVVAAVKVLEPQRVTDNPELARALEDEGDMLASIQHPNVVRFLDCCEVEDEEGTTWMLAMELVSGLTLQALQRSILSAGVPFPVSGVIYVVHAVADALSTAHTITDRNGEAMSVVHRDLKPRNLIVTRQGEVKVLDFGIAWASRRRIQPTQAGHTKGTITYMSPEQLLGRQLDGRSDLFSLGLIAYELFTGRRFLALDGTQFKSVQDAVAAAFRTRFEDREGLLREALLHEHDLAPLELDELMDLMGRLLARKRDRRPAGARALVEELQVRHATRLLEGRQQLLRYIKMVTEDTLTMRGLDTGGVLPTVSSGTAPGVITTEADTMSLDATLADELRLDPKRSRRK